jgi:hypothetical protein
LQVRGCGLQVGAMRQRVLRTIRRGRSRVVSKPLGVYTADTQERIPTADAEKRIPTEANLQPASCNL